MNVGRIVHASLPLAFAAAVGALGAACGEPRSPHDMQRNNPLGPSFWIIPVPSDDDSLLGRTFARSPDSSRTLEEQSAPNPCADKLQERRDAAMQNHFEDAIDTHSSAQAGALLSLYGFSADASVATHLLYKVDTQIKTTRLDTAEYQQCCREKGCGWGYVASLVKGSGEYASAKEASAQVTGNYTVVSAGVSRSYAVSTKREVKGYIAAILVEHRRADAAQNCPSGQAWAKIECVPKEKLAEQEELCKHGNPKASDPATKDNASMQAMYKQQRDDACKWLDQHGGPSAALPPPPPPPATSAAKPAATTAPAGFEPGEYTAINSFWSGKVVFRADGTLARDTGQKGVWIWDAGSLRIKWADGSEDQLAPAGEGAYKNMTGFFTLKRTGGVPAAPPPATSLSSGPAPAKRAPPAGSTAPAAPSGSAPALRKRP